jgi:hypothetical protein
MNITRQGIVNKPIIKPYTECCVETLTNGKTQVTVYGDTTNCENYILEELK